MSDSWLFPLTLTAMLGCGVVGGVFFAFSTFVMRGLARLPAPQGIAAMQSINVTAVRPTFMTALFGTAAVCLVVGVGAVVTWDDASAALPVAGSVLYLLGNIVVTGGGNVPLNNVLASVEPGDESAADQWNSYCRSWLRWNHVRTVTAALASVLFALSLTA